MKRERTNRSAADIRTKASEWVARIDGGLSASEEKEFHAWCLADPRHAEAVEKYGGLWKRLDGPRSLGATGQVRKAMCRIGRRKLLRRTLTGGLTAAIAMTIGAFWFTFQRTTLPQPIDGSSISIKGPERLSLPDGTVLEHPAGAVFALDFSDATRRRVILRSGSVHFDVARDPSRPFIVEAQGIGVEAVGTAFSIAMESGNVTVLVTQGRVCVTPQSPPSSPGFSSGTPVPTPDSAQGASSSKPSPSLLDAGQQLRVDAAIVGHAALPPARRLSEAEMASHLSWRESRVEFYHAPIREVLLTMNRHAAAHGQARFVLQDTSLGEMRMNGVVRLGDVDAFLGILRSGFGIRGERKDDGTISLSRMP